MLSRVLADFQNIDLATLRPAGFLARRAAARELSVRRVNAGHGWRTRDACPVCGTTGGEPLYECLGVCIRKCATCATGYTEQVPRDLGDVYGGGEYVEEANQSYVQNRAYRMQRFGTERIGLIRRLLGREPAGVRLLDLGCGTGWFLECAREAGFSATGQELGRELAAETGRRLGLQVLTEPVDQLDPALRFEVITLFDVIEHTPDPRGMLAALRRHLVPGGLLVAFTPNYDSLGFRALRERSSLVTPAEHLSYFCRRSLEWLAADLDFEIRLFETRGTDIADLLAYYRDDAARPQTAEFLAAEGAALQAALDKADCANHLRIVLARTMDGENPKP